MRELRLEGVPVLGRGEVAALTTPVGDRAGDAGDHLLDRALARRRVQLPAEVLLRDDVRRVLRPGHRELDVRLVEGDAVAMTDLRVPQLPLDGLERVHAGMGEQAPHRDGLAGPRGGGESGSGRVLDGHFGWCSFLFTV